MRRKQFTPQETWENQYKTLNDIQKVEMPQDSLKTMRPPKSPSINNHLLPCQMPIKQSMTIRKELSVENLCKNKSKSKINKPKNGQSHLELQLDLIRKIQSKRK